MPPSDLNYVTVSGFVLNFDSEPAEGRIEFCPTVSPVHFAEGYRIEAIPFEVVLDGDGFFAVDLIATDNAVLDPIDWNWRMTERIYGSPDRVFYLTLPAAEPVVHYADIVASGAFCGLSD